MENGFKEKFMMRMKEMGRKNKALRLLSLILTVIVMSFYHVGEAILGKKRGRKIVFVALISCVCLTFFVVLPSLAEESGLDDGMEIVEETQTPEPTEEPTEEPVETEVPEATAEPVEETEAPEATEEPEEEIEEAKEEEKVAATEAPEESQAEPEEEKEEIHMASLKKADADEPANITVDAPVIVTQPQDISVDYKAITADHKLTVEVEDVPSDVYINYQWYCDGEKISGADAKEDTYEIETGLSAGSYEYYCKVTAESVDDESVTASTDTDVAVVTVNKISPTEDMFSYSIADRYYYNAETQTIAVTADSSVDGLGSARISTWKNGKQTKFLNVGTYDLRLTVAEGDNYLADEFILDQTATMVQITPNVTYKVSGNKGNLVDDFQWYTGDVTINPATGYTISTAETGPYEDSLVISQESSANAPNVAPSKVYFKQNSTGGVTTAYSVDPFGIDKTAPTGSFSVDEDSWNSTLSFFKGIFYNRNNCFI